ncbi:MAG: ribonuclease P protein component [Firmicutes bacterium]|nr:ribonuclease P protein component [Bacillota bacterium]
MKGYESLKKEKDFKETFNKGQSYINQHFVLYVRPSEEKGQLKIAFCVGKKLGYAVKRNRIKRRMRHAFYSFMPQVARDYQIIVIARQKAREIEFSQFCSSLRSLFKKANLIDVQKDHY